MKSTCLRWVPATLAWLAAANGFGQTVTDSNVLVQTIVDTGAGLAQPTGLKFLGSNRNDFFVIEKASGQVKHFLNGASTVALDLPVASESERGLLGIALQPNFGKAGQPDNDKVYLYYSRSITSSDSTAGGWLENRLSRFTWNGTSLTNETVLAVLGSSTGQGGQATGPNHDGGPITFGPDGKLYGIMGDLNRSASEQNQGAQTSLSTSFVGGIYRLNSDGTVPNNNPFVATQTNASFQRLYAYGVRNSFGLTFDPANGALWDTENGPSSYDEINRVPAGFNSGWSNIMGPVARDAEGTADLINLAAGSTYSDPKFSWLTPVAVTSIQFLQGSNLGTAYNNKVLVGDNNNGNLYLFTLNAARDGFVLTGDLADLVADSTAERIEVRFGQSFGVVTGLERGPDGNIYAVNLSAGKVYRLVPKVLLGDFNRDYLLDGSDVQAMLAALKDLNAYRTQTGLSTSELLTLADTNGDLQITNADVQGLLTLLISKGSGAPAVPEPSSFLLCAAGTLASAMGAYCKGKQRRRDASQKSSISRGRIVEPLGEFC